MNPNEENEIKYNQSKKWIQYLVISSCSFIGIGLFLSAIVSIDEVITSRGKIENTGSIKLIKSSIEGNILDIMISFFYLLFVKNMDFVVADAATRRFSRHFFDGH